MIKGLMSQCKTIFISVFAALGLQFGALINPSSGNAPEKYVEFLQDFHIYERTAIFYYINNKVQHNEQRNSCKCISNYLELNTPVKGVLILIVQIYIISKYKMLYKESILNKDMDKLKAKDSKEEPCNTDLPKHHAAMLILGITGL